MTDEAWIEQSLGRLETLETQKGQLEASGQPVPAQLDEEIAALYEVLESAADNEGEAAQEPIPAPAPAPSAAPMAAPMAADPFAQATPGAPVAAPVPTPATPMADYADYDDDIKPSGGKGGLIAVGLVAVIGLGVGGWWFTQKKEPEAAPAPVGDPKVISASSVPEDTQEPQAAKGGVADRTEGTQVKEGPESARPSTPRRNGGGQRNRPKTKKGKDGRKVDLSDSRDPLAGI